MTKPRVYVATSIYAAALLLFWLVSHHSQPASELGHRFPFAFISFALLLAPLWFFAFGAGDCIRGRLQTPSKRISASALLGVPYLVFALPSGEFRWLMIVIFAIPVVLSAVLQFFAASPKASIADDVVLSALAAIYMLHLLSPAWPYASLSPLPKLFVADVALYLCVVVRNLSRMGYAFAQPGGAFLIGLREWLYFLPFGLGLGFALAFIHFHAHQPTGPDLFIAVVVTFFLIALPEELFFRGIIQNLLETRLGRTAALVLASILFGLAHFNKGADFNWRYVLLASIAGVFYGRAWRARHQLLASVITHTAVDVVWSLWFR